VVGPEVIGQREHKVREDDGFVSELTPKVCPGDEANVDLDGQLLESLEKATSLFYSADQRSSVS
jgi:hypothetical protein